MIEITWICDTCGEEVFEAHTQLEPLKMQTVPKGWIWVIDKAYCGGCRKYAGVTDGGEPEKRGTFVMKRVA